MFSQKFMSFVSLAPLLLLGSSSVKVGSTTKGLRSMIISGNGSEWNFKF